MRKGEKRKCPLLTYIVMTIIRCDVFLVQVAIRRHRIPGPSRVPSNSTDVIPVIFGTCVVYHIIWVGLEGVSGLTVTHDGSLLIVLVPPKTFPRG